MAQNTTGLKGQGRMSTSSVKVTDLLNQLLLNKHKKFEDDAIARFCCNVLPLPRWKQTKTKKNTEIGSITILTESTSRSIIIIIPLYRSTFHNTIYTTFNNFYYNNK